MTTITADGPPFSYTPPEVAAPNVRQVMTTFTPPTPRGPVLIHTDAHNFLDAAPRTEFDDVADPSVVYVTALYRKGVTIVSAGLSGFNGGHVGGGLWRSYHSNDYLNDWIRTWPERDAEHVIQKVKRMLFSGTLAGNAGMIGWVGVSSGSIAGLSCALGPDRKRSAGSEQVRTSTRIRFGIALEPIVWSPAYDLSLASGKRWPMGGVGDAPAAHMEDVPHEMLVESSPLSWLADMDAAGLPQPSLYVAFDEPDESTNFDFDGDGLPTLYDSLTTVHPYWQGVVLARSLEQANARRYERRTRLVVTNGIELPPPDDVHDIVVPRLYGQYMQTDLVAWLERELRGTSFRRVGRPEPMDPAPHPPPE